MAPDVRSDERHQALNPADTIYALSSGQPPAAVAIVRISGPAAAAALEALARKRPEPRHAATANLRHPVSGELLDRALILFFAGPASATGEDIAELHLHGGRSVVAAVMEALANVPGLRPAAPGEFTRRALESGRIDLAEAEGLADLLLAETQSQRRAALTLASGRLSRQVEDWRQRLLTAAAMIEAELDFQDEGDVDASAASAAGPIVAVLGAEFDEWLARPPAERLRDGIRVVIAGPPNAGKSSLINALSGRDAAITSTIPGTTRDIVEAPTVLGGVPFLLIDTAGLRETQDEIETIGVNLARTNVDRADLVLWLGEPRDAPAKSIRVHSKVDICPAPLEAEIAVSARTGQGIDELVALVLVRSRSLLPNETEAALNARHRSVLGECRDHLHEAASAHDPLVTAEALRQCRAALDRITGRAGVEDMLDALFGRFCIGK